MANTKTVPRMVRPCPKDKRVVLGEKIGNKAESDGAGELGPKKRKVVKEEEDTEDDTGEEKVARAGENKKRKQREASSSNSTSSSSNDKEHDDMNESGSSKNHLVLSTNMKGEAIRFLSHSYFP